MMANNKSGATADQSLDAKTADKALSVDLLNILKKAKSGRPLTRYERGVVESAKSKHIAINVKTRKRSVSVKTYIFDSMAACSSGGGMATGTRRMPLMERSHCPIRTPSDTRAKKST